jgi:CBS domain containing-hemolysin-like protein
LASAQKASPKGEVWVLVALYVICLLFAAYFALSETAFAAVSKVKLRTLADKGNKGAKKALWIGDRFDKTLTTILIGNNIFHAAGAAITTLFLVEVFGDKADLFSLPGTFVTALIVYLFAEMIPKSIAKVHSESLALHLASPMKFLVKFLSPISAVFSAISKGIARLFHAKEESAVTTEEDIIDIIETIEDEGVLEPEKQALVNSAMEFREKLAEDIMVPMEQVVCVSSTISKEKLVRIIKESPYSRIPVYEGNPENIIGILPANQYLSLYTAKKPIVLRKILLKPYVFDHKTEITELLQRMRLNKLHMIFVINEKRKKIGLITMEDLLEELVGEIQDETDVGEGLDLV